MADKIRQAIQYSSPDEAISLIQQSEVDLLDGEEQTPLIHASIHGKLDILSWLINHGAAIDHQDRNGLTALHLAIQSKQFAIASELLKHRANIALKDKFGNAPLWRAVFDARGKYDFVTLLLQNGARPEDKNNNNKSPMDLATTFGDQVLVQILQNHSSNC
ncbi:MAG: ankyrin repeat domain-containing protein [Planctomycetia bacterium]|nr:ankyrin repeat domain-containing protein [Planctomycetia bacterium]